MSESIISLPSTAMLAAALLVAAVVAAIAIMRRIQLPRGSLFLGAAGMALLVMAVGGATWRRADPRRVVVMVDLSPSTRTASYRDPGTLHRRIGQLVGKTPYRVVYFAGENQDSAPAGNVLPDIPTARTRFNPPPADALLLFGDGRFELPASVPPTYIAIDAMLQDPADALVQRLEVRGRVVTAAVASGIGEARQVHLDRWVQETSGDEVQLAAGLTIRSIERGEFLLTERMPPGTNAVRARIAGTDPWPENDQIALRLAPPPHSARWWVGASDPGRPWMRMDPAQLPIDPSAWLAPAIIALENIPAANLSDPAQARLRQYVGELGGSLLIIGGDKAFAAGGYPGTVLESLSPLASSPPAPTLQWVLLLDSSGSMAEGAPGATRWNAATQAMLRLLPHLPPEDPVRLGNFAESVRWWSAGKSARETGALRLPPPDVSPSGPTNLEAAVWEVVRSSADAMPRELMLMSDGDAEFTRVDALLRELKSRKIRLHLLAIGGDGRGIPALRELAAGTGGQVLTELDPARWTEAARKLFQLASPDRFNAAQAPVQFVNELAPLPSRQVSPWNRTWLKSGAALLGRSLPPREGEQAIPLVARWPAGAGQVVSVAFAPLPAEREAMCQLVMQPPRDPRFAVTWETGSRTIVTVDANADGRPLNDLELSLELLPLAEGAGAPRVQQVPQVGPGRYRVELDAAGHDGIATLRHSGGIVDRAALPARYAPEFDAVGNDVAALQELADRSGGRVISPAELRPIDFSWPRRPMPLAPWLSIAGGVMLAAALVWWRVG